MVAWLHVLHIQFHDRTDFDASAALENRAAAGELGSTIEQGGCWGTLVEDVERICTEDADYTALLDILTELKESRALLLFVMAVRHRPDVFALVARRAHERPRTVQCALVSLPEVDQVKGLPRDKLCAAAREILGSDRAREQAREEYEAHTRHLHAFNTRCA